MTSHSKKTAAKKVYRKRSELSPEEALKAKKRAEYQRKWRNKQKAGQVPMESAATKKKAKADAGIENIDLIITFNQAAKAYEAKIASLEHQAVQYRTVIDYLESKIDSQRLPK
jgi:hypothetical protein